MQPLEGLTETLSDFAPLPSYSSVPTSKSNVPCYFYFNSYCIKGNHCPFLHDILPAQKVPATASEAVSIHPVEQKTSTESDTEPASLEVPANLLEGTPELIEQCMSKEAFQQPPLEEKSPSVESSVPGCGKPAIKLSDNLLPSVDYVNLRAHLCRDQSSDELVKECAEPDEWWESSPGFDVLVDGGSEQLPCEHDTDSPVAQEKESNILHGHQFQDDFESSAAYDHRDYSDVGHMYEHGLYNSYDYLDRYNPEYFERNPEYYRERILEPMFHQRRKLPQRAHGVVVNGGLDLRDHLRKRRRMDFYQDFSDSWNLHSYQRSGHSRERLVRHEMGQFPGRSASKVGKNMAISSHSKTRSTLNDHRRHGWLGWLGEYPRSSRHSRSKQKEREARRRKHRKPLPTLYSEISQGSPSKKVKSFSGPKILAEIKEAKSRAKTNVDGSESCMPQRLRRPSSGDFEGPKPLNELLKDKGKPVSISGNINGPTNPTAKQQPKHIISQVERGVSNGCYDDTCYHEATEKHDRLYDSISFDVDEEDGLHEKLARILAQ